MSARIAYQARRTTSSLIRHKDRPDNWTLPRAQQDACARYRKHGPIQPMEYERGLLEKLFGGRP